MTTKFNGNNGINANRIAKKSNNSFSSKEKIRILTEGIHNEFEFSEICNREGIKTDSFYKWCFDFIKNTQGKIVESEKPEDIFDETNRIQIENKLLRHLIKELDLKNSNLKRKLKIAV